jgi:hypothetical protein
MLALKRLSARVALASGLFTLFAAHPILAAQHHVVRLAEMQKDAVLQPTLRIPQQGDQWK